MHFAGYMSIFCFLRTPIIGPSHEIQLLIGNNPLTCDCRDYDIIAKLGILTRSDFLDGVRCNLPSQLYGDKVSVAVCHTTRGRSSAEISILDFASSQE